MSTITSFYLQRKRFSATWQHVESAGHTWVELWQLDQFGNKLGQMGIFHLPTSPVAPRLAAQLAQAFIDLLNDRVVDRKVVIEVSGGVAEVTRQPDDVEVQIIDHDNIKADREGPEERPYLYDEPPPPQRPLVVPPDMDEPERMVPRDLHHAPPQEGISAGIAVTPDTINALIVEYSDWCEAQGLPLKDATGRWMTDYEDLTTEQRRWLRGYSDRWEAVCRADAEARGPF